jgi:phosphatidate cytidylyltransferase
VLRDRVITAIILLALLAGALVFLPALGWALFMFLFLLAAAWEWAALARARGAVRIVFAVVTATAALALAWHTGLTQGAPGAVLLQNLYLAVGAFWLIVAPLWLRWRPQQFPSAGVLILGLPLLVAVYCAIVQLRNAGPLLMLSYLAVPWIADIAAYFVGRRFGKRKLAPRISPGKTWAGVYGAFAATAVYGVLWLKFMPADIPFDQAVTISLFVLIAVLTFAGIVGDLFESALKRAAGLKDSGAMLPGHGGVLDRIDALLPVLPLAAWVTMS